MKRLLPYGACVLLACAPQTVVAGSSWVHLNEVVPSNHHSCSDETGGSPDWIELYNASAVDVNLAGYALANHTRAVTDADRLGSVVVPAGGYRVLWADGRPELGPEHLPFKLNAEGEMVLFYGPDKAMLDRIDWSAASTDVAIARFPDGLGIFVSCGAPTCKVKNGASCAKTGL